MPKLAKILSSGSGGLSVILFFFMPWITVSCAGFVEETYSGYDLATGQAGQSSVLLWVIVLVGLLTLILLAVSQFGEFPPMPIGIFTIALGLLGFVVLAFEANRLANQVGNELGLQLSTVEFVGNLFGGIPQLELAVLAISFDAEWGLYFVLLGFVLIVVGGFLTILLDDGITEDTSFGADPFNAGSSNAFYGDIGGSSLTDASYSGGAPTDVLGSGGQPSIGGGATQVETSSSSFSSAPTTPLAPQQPFPGQFSPQQPFPPAQPVAGQPFAGSPQSPHKMTEVLSRKPQNAWIVIREADGLMSGKTYPIDEESMLEIGREGSGIRLADKAASSRHAAVRKDGSTYIIQDLASTNGTFIRRGDEWVQIYREELKDGDQIKIGRSIFSFVRLQETIE